MGSHTREESFAPGSIEKKLFIPLSTATLQHQTNSDGLPSAAFQSITPISMTKPTRDSFSMSEHKPPVDKKNSTLTHFGLATGVARNVHQKTDADIRLTD